VDAQERHVRGGDVEERGDEEARLDRRGRAAGELHAERRRADDVERADEGAGVDGAVASLRALAEGKRRGREDAGGGAAGSRTSIV
jgi:hypothetical protein